ncbi:uncharacterized protein LOC144908131 [Branchiostoma floridae x Branchiostoma belcheri]
MSTKMRVLRALVWPVVTYGCEAWTLHAKDTQKIEAFEMKCYRKLLRVSWTEHRTNASVLEELGIGRSLLHMIRRRKLQYFGHVLRAQNISTHILQGRICGSRSRGRPRRRWVDDIRDWTGRSLADCTQMAKDRDGWRKLVLYATTVPDPPEEEGTRLEEILEACAESDRRTVEYTQFIKAFKHAIEDKTQDPEDRLHYLGQYTRGEARELVTSCVLMDPEEGFKEAKRLLEERYGTPFKVSRAYAEEAKRWSEIKHDDKPALRKFSLFLTKCLNAMKGDQYLQELDHYTNIALLVGKLPYRLKERWRRKSHDIQRQGRVKFKDLVDFVKQEEQVLSNDIFDDKSAKESFKRSPGTRYQRDRAKGSSLAVTTEPDQNRAFCQFCNSESHGLTMCKKLGGKPYKERLDYVKQKGLCFGCLRGTKHLAKECRNKATCETCQMPHPTVLHRDTPHKQASVGCVSAEGVPSIIPVLARSKSSGTTMKTYAFLDTGSDVTFCTNKLKQQLNTKGRKTKLTLNTINSSKETLTELVEDLEVSSLDGVNTIRIPVAYTQEKIPVSKANIVSKEDLRDYAYLKDVELPAIDAEIGLLIGNNVPKAMEPWQIINSEGEGPYAVRTLLGWSVNGPLRGASGESANVNRISLEEQLDQYFNNDFNEKIEDKK